MAHKSMVLTQPGRYGTRMLQAGNHITLSGPQARLLQSLGRVETVGEYRARKKAEEEKAKPAQQKAPEPKPADKPEETRQEAPKPAAATSRETAASETPRPTARAKARQDKADDAG